MAGHTSQPKPVAWPIILCLLLLYGCAAPIQELWPPPQNAPSHTIVVSLDTWHAMIAFALEEPRQHSGASADSHPAPLLDRKTAFEEWGYAEQAWYLEGRQGFTGTVRALFWPSPGVVEVGLHGRIWASRTPQPPSDVFVFRLSETGYQRLRRHLRATIGATEPLLVTGGSKFYPSKRSYHLFHQCHQYAALALREAGLPLSAFWSFNRAGLAMQLRQAVQLAADQSVALAIEDFPAGAEAK
jgi:hypothetical protein